MAVSEDTKNRVRILLGYGGVQMSATTFLGVPAGVETAFMVEGAFPRLLPSIELRLLAMLDKAEEIDRMIFESAESIEASEVGNIKLRDDAMEKYVQRYLWFQGQVANMLQIPANPFDMRFKGYGGGGGINVPVTG
jgi:hypothetical protein